MSGKTEEWSERRRQRSEMNGGGRRVIARVQGNIATGRLVLMPDEWKWAK